MGISESLAVRIEGDAQMLPSEKTNTESPRVAVVGVGGAGCNIVSAFAGSGCPVDTIAINTDKDALHRSTADTKIYICKAVLKGEGTRGDAELGRRCADIHREEIKDSLLGYDFVFVLAGLGGGTGSGALPTVIDAATVGGAEVYTIAVSPFSFEGSRKAVAKEAYQRVKAVCRNTMLLDNDLLMPLMDDLDMKAAFDKVNESVVNYISDCVAWISKSTKTMSRSVEDKPRKSEKSEVLPIGMIVSA